MKKCIGICLLVVSFTGEEALAASVSQNRGREVRGIIAPHSPIQKSKQINLIKLNIGAKRGKEVRGIIAPHAPKTNLNINRNQQIRR